MSGASGCCYRTTPVQPNPTVSLLEQLGRLPNAFGGTEQHHAVRPKREVKDL